MKAAFPIQSARLLPGAVPSDVPSSLPGRSRCGSRFALSLCVLLGGATAGIALSAPAAAQAPAPAQAARYPLDPVCPWGRLADGHGLLVRCLERGEAQGLLSGAAGPATAAPAPYGASMSPATVSPALPPTALSPTPAAPPRALQPAYAPALAPGATLPPGAVPPAAAQLPAPAQPPPAAQLPPTAQLPAATQLPPPAGPPLGAAVPGAPSAAAAPRSTKIHRKVSVREVGSAVADTGELPEAQVQLRKVTDRYAQCVVNNGGLEGVEGRVTVRFLVRERGRAEGVAVKDRQGVSLAAAKCVAEVVDRRFVGYPAEPFVGATLNIDFMPEGATR